jgi:hypothetical protein
VQQEMLLYQDPGPMPQRFFVVSGGHEPGTWLSLGGTTPPSTSSCPAPRTPA